MVDNPDQPVKDHFQVRLLKTWKIISELNQLSSLVRVIPQDDDLTATNVQVERTKTHTFGISYFVPDPFYYGNQNNLSELGDSVVGVTKDGSGHTQHFRNVFKHTHRNMRVI